MRTKVYKNKKAEQQIKKTYDELLLQWGTHFLELDIPTSYGTTHVIECGISDAPPLVLFHGVGDDSALMWIYNASELSRHFHLYAIDTLGGPGKSVPNKVYDSDFDDTDWIDQVLEHLGIKEAFFAGVSNGGYLVQLYTLNRMEKVIRAISISGAVPAKATGNPMKIMMKVFLPEALFPSDKNIMKLVRKLCGKNYAAMTENPLIMQHYKFLLKGFNNMAMGRHRIQSFTDQQIDLIRGKVEYLTGLEDPFAKLGGAAALQEHHMQVTFYEAAGHALNHEKAEIINGKIVEIFEKSLKAQKENSDY